MRTLLTPWLGRSLAAVILLTVAAACGSVAGGPGASPPPTAPAQLTVTDDQRTVSLHVGQSVEVALQQQPGYSEWSHPTATDTAVLAPQVDPRAAAVRGMTLASFKAVAKGRTDIRSAAGAACSPGVACPALARGWQVHVVVS